jgi:heptaprenyl diphosphate synthase
VIASEPQLDALGYVVPDAALERELKSGLVAVEALLRESVKSSYPFVTETARHLVNAGGKRFRPLLVLLASHFADPAAAGVVPSAVVVELTHLATLYHDDVMDEAGLRRGGPSANARWGNMVAILTGDFLFSRASDILADLGPECVRVQARTFERLVHGQIREVVGPEDGADPLDHYLRVVADKTGSLIGTSARFGAMLSGADEKTTEVLTRYGEHMGVAFQLSDDLLDVVSDPGASGKTPGTDLREGVVTLPTLLVRRDRDASSERLRQLLSGPLTDATVHAEALELLRAHPALAEARTMLQRWTDEAREAIDPLPECPAKDALVALADFVVARTG